MKRLLIALVMLMSVTTASHAQVAKIAAGNTLIGTANGALVGVGVMGLTNSSNVAPLRFGVGAGTLFGLGVGIYDASRMGRFGTIYNEGLFNSTEYTSLIVFLDTFYGGATGALLGMAFSLMLNEPIIDGIQYGTSAGILVGFGFGLVDAFYFSKSSYDYTSTLPTSGGNDVAGLIILSTGEKVRIGMVEPTLYTGYSLNNAGNIAGYSITPGLNIANLRLNF